MQTVPKGSARAPRQVVIGKRARRMTAPAQTVVPHAVRAEERTHGDHHLVRELRTRWRFIALVTLVALLLGVAASLLLPKQYDAETQLLVSVSSADDAVALSQGSDFSEQRVQTYMSVATSRPVMEKVIEDLGLHTTPNELAEKVTAEAVPETVLLTITARDTDPDLAAEIANSTAENLMAEIGSLEKGDGENSTPVRTVVVENAIAPTTASSPSVLRNGLLAMIGGCALAIMYVYLRSILDTKVRSADALAEGTPQIPMLARIPRDPGRASDPAVISGHGAFTTSEAYRMLRTRLRYANIDGSVSSIMVTSVAEGEGKSSVASLLAAALADSGVNVLLIDADLRRPSIAEKFGLEGDAGLTAVLTRQASFRDVVQESPTTGVQVMTAGVESPNPAELLESQTMRDLLSELSEEYDLVIIDTPPVMATADTLSVAAVADEVLLVVRTDGKVTRRAVLRAVDSLTFVGARLLGTVATFSKVDRSQASSYYY
ncbi:polysaccharide biosynthesis tyrosine autokinase [Brachybacterium endophyticum]|uniref:polysaccharide biosynthesis tyrosine autokinase n=1 Tax=Brachybacterium endophyticum TaxID=2182385 RepID=UPI0014035CB2|nr:polysaccharide biosynthesis tyrosine autokinase [Brachybacterium endophyticum]